jgi:hypothetical protein
MSSIQDPGNPRTTAVGDGHVVHHCCGRIDRQPHRNFCEKYVPARTPEIKVADVRQLARRVADAGFDIDPDGDPTYLVERINALLTVGVPPTPPESEWAPFPVCPGWCTGEHRGEDEQFRDCESEEMFVPALQGGGGTICVNLGRAFNRATGLSGPEVVRLDDYEFTSQYARRLGQLLIRAADLQEAHEG